MLSHSIILSFISRGLSIVESVIGELLYPCVLMTLLLLHVDRFVLWFVLTAGVGCQFLAIATGVLVMAVMGMFNVHRHGSIDIAVIVLYALTSCMLHYVYSVNISGIRWWFLYQDICIMIRHVVCDGNFHCAADCLWLNVKWLKYLEVFFDE